MFHILGKSIKGKWSGRRVWMKITNWKQGQVGHLCKFDLKYVYYIHYTVIWMVVWYVVILKLVILNCNVSRSQVHLPQRLFRRTTEEETKHSRLLNKWRLCIKLNKNKQCNIFVYLFLWIWSATVFPLFQSIVKWIK